MNNLPVVEVIQDGQVMPGARVDPGVMQFVIQMAIASQQVRIRKLLESKQSVGTQSLKRTVTTTTLELTGLHWNSLSLINDGTDDVYIGTNEDGLHDVEDLVPVKQNETINIDLGGTLIYTIYLKSAGSSSVRVHGKVAK